MKLRQIALLIVWSKEHTSGVYHHGIRIIKKSPERHNIGHHQQHQAHHIFLLTRWSPADTAEKFRVTIFYDVFAESCLTLVGYLLSLFVMNIFKDIVRKYVLKNRQ